MTNWVDIADLNDPEIDRFAAAHHIHPLHVEDTRDRDQRAKVEEGNGYIYLVLKVIESSERCGFDAPDLNVFLGNDWVLTIREKDDRVSAELLKPIRAIAGDMRPDQLFHRIFDTVVDSYTPLLDQVDEAIDEIEEAVLNKATPAALARLFALKRNLIEMRRVLVNTRDVAAHLQRTENDLIRRDMWPFLRDVYDHVAHNLDTVETQRDLLASSLDVYLSTTANRTNQVMKVLTVLGTVALPAVVVSSVYGMNIKGLPFADSPNGAMIVAVFTLVLTLLLLGALKRFDWW